MVIRTALHTAGQVLRAAGISSADLDSELLLSHILKKDRAHVLAHGDCGLSQQEEKVFFALVEQRKKRVPLAYLTGYKEFFGLDLLVTKDVLIPRGETETLVEIVLTKIKNLFPLTIIDVGTGSGAIALALAARTPEQVNIIALDSSDAALAIAHKNATHLKLSDRIEFLKSDLLSTFATSYKLQATSYLIVANLPYLSEKDYDRAIADCPEIAYEPRSALVSGPDGTELIEKLLLQAAKTAPDSPIFLEIGEKQGASVTALASRIYPSAVCEIQKDLSGRDRFALIHSQDS